MPSQNSNGKANLEPTNSKQLEETQNHIIPWGRSMPELFGILIATTIHKNEIRISKQCINNYQYIKTINTSKISKINRDNNI